MRLPLPPARINPVTEDSMPSSLGKLLNRSTRWHAWRRPLRHQRRRDGLPEAVLAGEEQVVLAARRAADHGDAELRRDLVAHFGEARAGYEEGNLHLRGFDHHLGGEASGRIEDLVRAVHAVEPHLARDRIYRIVPSDVLDEVEDLG